MIENISALFNDRVMMLITWPTSSGWPQIARGIGARFVRPDMLAVLVAGSRYPAILGTDWSKGWTAVTVARVTDYTSCQIKGPAELHETVPQDLELVAAYRSRITALFGKAGAEHGTIDEWIGGTDLRRIVIKVCEVYDQTPGPRAGTTVKATAWS
ncbi:hypothetical protein RPMA_06395 [Tardiphaga alba]|uniref:Pyridoxamine 5'-phosphate oxidase putative domain-containing protein n=1 Tax=Tardiphaga alba TaxID=340268 RepID=A0ABX8A4N1_9BRAD|nr:hypothetical protein [Tardiphaga alba]QUS38502.1 hypothetical protein RPMA_06395 [Tardiphaga alba]